MREAGLQFWKDKCVFLAPSVVYLGAETLFRSLEMLRQVPANNIYMVNRAFEKSKGLLCHLSYVYSLTQN